MRTLLSLLWTDQVGSTMSAEMALVTSVTVGALFMGMADFSATVNQEFQNSARLARLMNTEDVVTEKAAAEEEAKEEEAEKNVGWRFRRAEDQDEQQSDQQDSE